MTYNKGIEVDMELFLEYRAGDGSKTQIWRPKARKIKKRVK